MKDEFDKMIKDPRGWITDKGACLWSEMYRHVEDLEEKVKDEPECEWVLKECHEWSEEKTDCKQGCIDLADAGEHPAWHVYEMWLYDAEPDFRQKFLKMLYKKGWVRVGNGPGIVSFEGSKEGLAKNRRVIDDILKSGDWEESGEIDVREVG